MTDKINISREGHKQALDKWYGHWEKLTYPSPRCDYCRETDFGCCECALDGNICSDDNSVYDKYVNEVNSKNPRKRWLKCWARKIYLAIVADGRRLGYEMDEAKIKEVMGE
jgi:hypothetical protein